jgi:TonB-linked SusC/RagA family outer membrane protein
METDDKVMSEIVVTALGFKEERDKLGATYSKVNTEAIGRSGETGIITALSGKAAGVQITRSSGDPGAGAYIQIRGQSTILGNVQPLVIVDGVPISNSTIGTSSNQVDGVIQQSRMNDINPDDIETLQILKGPSAAALWGTRAANGVVVITTKKGKNNDKVNISFRSSYSIDQINRKHKLQTIFGQGSAGRYSPTSSLSWGDKISERAGGADALNTTGAFFESQSGNKYYPITKKNDKTIFTDNNFDNVYQNGSFWDNSISFSGGDAKNTFMMSFSDLNQKGIIKNNSDYRRTTVRFNTGRTFNKYFAINTTASYASIVSNRIQMGSNTAGLMLGLLRTPPDFDNKDYKGTFYTEEGGLPYVNAHRSYRRYLGGLPSGSFDGNPIYNNPSWTINEQKNSSKVSRIIGSFEMIANPMDALSIIGRLGIDSYSDYRTSYQPLYSAAATNGYFEENELKETQTNLDLIARYSKDFAEDLTITAIAGFNYNNRFYRNVNGTNNAFILPDAPANFNNGTTEVLTPSNYKQTIRTAAAYLSASVGFKDQLYIDVTGRSEAASTFGPVSQGQFFYPSASAAWQFSQIESLKGNEILSFGKVRASWGVVGVQPDPYRVYTILTPAVYSESWGPYLDASLYGGSFNRSSLHGNPNLKPERKTELEFGTDLRFFDNAWSLSLTYFTNETKDVLLPVAVAPSSGYSSIYANAATIQNKGFEIETSYNLIDSEDLKVAITGNWTRYRNEVTSLSGAQSLLLNGFTGTSSRAVAGEALGTLWGGRWERDETGKLVLDDNGFPKQALTEGILGDPNPDWRAGLGASASYKGLTFSFLFERQQGGDMWNGTLGVLNHFGVSQNSATETVAAQDLKTIGGKKIAAGQTFRGVVHDFGAGPVALEQDWYTSLGGGFGPIGEQFIYDASWTRLREVTLGYSLPSDLCKKAKLQAVDFTITGRNLMLWTNWEGIDPETNLTGASNGRGLEYFNNPNTRSYLFTLKVTY